MKLHTLIIMGIVPGSNTGYLIGGIIALLILIYLLYSLIKPEKF